MATSGSTDFTLNRDEIIEGALRFIGVLATGASPSADEVTDASEALNLIAKELQALDVGLWLNLEVTLTLVEDQASYSLGPTGTDTTSPATITRPLAILEARYVDDDDNETPLTEISLEEYTSISDKTISGRPTCYYIDKQLTDIDMKVWPVPDSDTSNYIKFTSKTVVEDFDATANNADFPVEWLRTLKFLLARDIAPEYGITGQRLLEINSYADAALTTVMGFDTEDTSVFIGADNA